MLHAKAGAVKLRAATENDVPRIAELEARPDYAPFINRWPSERHHRAMADPDFAYFAFQQDEQWQGYAILAGLQSPNRAIQLVRIALKAAGGGRGRAAMQLLMQEVFVRRDAHRFHLDLFEGNSRAERLYASLGFRHEGVLREAELREDGFRSLVLMAILAGEYEGGGG